MVSGIDAVCDMLLLGRWITIGCSHGICWIRNTQGVALPAIERFGHLWTSAVQPNHELFTIPGANSRGRRLVDVGSVRINRSPLRAVQTFLDISHFPFVPTDIPGAEPHTEVGRYDVKIRQDVDEVWKTRSRANCHLIWGWRHRHRPT